MSYLLILARVSMQARDLGFGSRVLEIMIIRSLFALGSRHWITLAAVTVCMHPGPASLAGPAYSVEGKSAGSMRLLLRVTYIQSELSWGRARSATVICQRTVDSCQDSSRTSRSSRHEL